MEDLVELAVVCFIIYLLYKLVVGFIMPVAKAASQIKTKVNEFNQAQQQMRQQQTAQRQQPTPAPRQSSKEDDYIDFEEVK